MTKNTISNKNAIPVLSYNDKFGVDDASDLNGSDPIVKKASSEQIRYYNNVGCGTQLKKTHAKLAAIRTSAPGTAYLRIAIISDSTGAGKNSTSDADKMDKSWPGQLVRHFKKAGFHTNRSAYFGSGDATNFSAYDPRVTQGSGWSNSGANTLGGVMPLNSTTTGSNAFKPYEQWNAAKVYYPIFGSGGVLSIDVNGTGAVTQSTAGANGIGVKTITPVTLGINTLNVARSSGLCIYAGVECWDNTKNQVQIFNCGWGGATVGDMISTAEAWGPSAMLTRVAPDLTIFGGMINDMNNGTDLTVFATKVESSITTALALGDVMWMTGVPTAASSTPLATQELYVKIIRDKCAAYGVPVIDEWARFQSYEISQPLGLYSDQVHPAGPGYDLKARDAFNMICPIGLITEIPTDIYGTDASAGMVGELITSTVAIGSATSLTTATAKTITSITLQPGDYDIWGSVGFIANTGTIPTKLIASINTTTNTQATSPNDGAFVQLEATLGTASTNVLPVGSMRVHPSVPTTYYIVGTAEFSVSTMTAYACINARSRR